MVHVPGADTGGELAGGLLGAGGDGFGKAGEIGCLFIFAEDAAGAHLFALVGLHTFFAESSLAGAPIANGIAAGAARGAFVFRITSGAVEMEAVETELAFVLWGIASLLAAGCFAGTGVCVYAGAAEEAIAQLAKAMFGGFAAVSALAFVVGVDALFAEGQATDAAVGVTFDGYGFTGATALMVGEAGSTVETAAVPGTNELDGFRTMGIVFAVAIVAAGVAGRAIDFLADLTIDQFAPTATVAEADMVGLTEHAIETGAGLAGHVGAVDAGVLFVVCADAGVDGAAAEETAKLHAFAAEEGESVAMGTAAAAMIEEATAAENLLACRTADFGPETAIAAAGFLHLARSGRLPGGGGLLRLRGIGEFHEIDVRSDRNGLAMAGRVLPILGGKKLVEAGQALVGGEAGGSEQFTDSGIKIEMRANAEGEMDEGADFGGVVEAERPGPGGRLSGAGHGLRTGAGKGRDGLGKVPFDFGDAMAGEGIELGEAKRLDLIVADGEHGVSRLEIAGMEHVGGKGIPGAGVGDAAETEAKGHFVGGDVVGFDPGVDAGDGRGGEDEVESEASGGGGVAEAAVGGSDPIAELGRLALCADVADADGSDGAVMGELNDPEKGSSGKGVGTELGEPIGKGEGRIVDGEVVRVIQSAFEEVTEGIGIAGASRPEEHRGVRISHSCWAWGCLMME